MSETLKVNSQAAVAGLGTQTLTIVNAGIYTVAVQSTLPPASALQIVINVNGSPQLTIGGVSTNPTPTQPSIGSSVRLQCAAGDVITVVLSSANAVDNQPNAVKSSIDIYLGE